MRGFIVSVINNNLKNYPKSKNYLQTLSIIVNYVYILCFGISILIKIES